MRSRSAITRLADGFMGWRFVGAPTGSIASSERVVVGLFGVRVRRPFAFDTTDRDLWSARRIGSCRSLSRRGLRVGFRQGCQLAPVTGFGTARGMCRRGHSARGAAFDAASALWTAKVYGDAGAVRAVGQTYPSSVTGSRSWRIGGSVRRLRSVHRFRMQVRLGRADDAGEEVL